MTVIRAVQAVHEALKPLVKDRCWYMAADEKNTVKPYIVFGQTSIDRLTDMNGYTGHAQIRMQVDIYDDEPMTLAVLGEAVINAIDALTTVSASVQNDNDGYEETNRLFRKSIDFLIWEQTQ